MLPTISIRESQTSLTEITELHLHLYFPPKQGIRPSRADRENSDCTLFKLLKSEGPGVLEFSQIKNKGDFIIVF